MKKISELVQLVYEFSRRRFKRKKKRGNKDAAGDYIGRRSDEIIREMGGKKRKSAREIEMAPFILLIEDFGDRIKFHRRRIDVSNDVSSGFNLTKGEELLEEMTIERLIEKLFSELTKRLVEKQINLLQQRDLIFI